MLNLSSEEFKNKFGIEKFADDGSEVVIHCAVGGRGMKATLAALQLGYFKLVQSEAFLFLFPYCPKNFEVSGLFPFTTTKA